MKWYNWIAMAIICLAGFTWIVLPDKAWWLHTILIALIAGGVLFVKYMPDEKLEKGEDYMREPSK